MADISKTILGIFDTAKVIFNYKTKFFKDIPMNKRSKAIGPLPLEIDAAVKLAKEILDEKEKDASGVFCITGINKTNQEIVVAISDGIHDLNDLITLFNEKRWKSFRNPSASILAQVKELSERTTRFFHMFASSVLSDASPSIDVETILTDSKAINFWKVNIQPSL